jgi:hypothetical protein
MLNIDQNLSFCHFSGSSRAAQMHLEGRMFETPDLKHLLSKNFILPLQRKKGLFISFQGQTISVLRILYENEIFITSSRQKKNVFQLDPNYSSSIIIQQQYGSAQDGSHTFSKMMF